MTGTQSKQQTAGVQAVLSHAPLKGASGNKVVEIWTQFRVDFLLGSAGGCLQPNQYVPMNSMGKTCANIKVDVTSAKVFGGRYLVAGGNDKAASHPLIVEYSTGGGAKGSKSELLAPGGSRSLLLNPSVPFIGAMENSQLTRFKASAASFHNSAQQAQLVEQSCPLVIAARADTPIPGAVTAPAYNVMTGDVCTIQLLPIPTILSAPERQVAVDQAFCNWIDAVKQFMSAHSIVEYGMYWNGSEAVTDVMEEISPIPAELVYRAPMEQDMGVATLDSPELFEMLLPFQGGEYRP